MLFKSHHPTIVTSKNTIKNSKKGRPFKDPVSKYRTLLWYWAIRQKSKLSDGKLDIEFSDLEPDGRNRSYADRVRVFEDIRKSGATVSDGKHKRRNFNLVERVDNHTDLKGSAKVYQSLFWEVLSDSKPTLEKTKNNFVKLINICEFNNIKLHKYSPPNAAELKKLSDIFKKTPNELTEILEPNVFTNDSKAYDEILQSFSNVTHFRVILKTAEFNELSKYLNILAFYISFYRYAMLTANFHALVSAANSIEEHLSLLLLDSKWLKKDFTKGLFYLIYQRVFHSGSKEGLSELDINTLDEILNSDSALYKLFELLS